MRARPWAEVPPVAARAAFEAATPRYRGLLHQHAFFASVPMGALLVAVAPSVRAALAALPFALSLSLCLGVSAAYHRHRWSPRRWRWMSRADRAAIFLFISGTYTSVALLALGGAARTGILTAEWAAAAAGILIVVTWPGHPGWAEMTAYICAGWAALAAWTPLLAAVGPAAMTLLGAGGVLYTVGAAVYALKRPDPRPSSFGYHEIFHALVLAGATAHYGVILALVLTVG